MNGNYLLMFSQMKQHQESLLREVEGRRAARMVRQAKQYTADPETGSRGAPTRVDPRRIGVLLPGSGSMLRLPRPDPVHREGVGRPGRLGPSRLRRLAARFGNSLVAVGQRLERMDKL